jgi:U3 small nucleolar RNA-associated protein 4
MIYTNYLEVWKLGTAKNNEFEATTNEAEEEDAIFKPVVSRAERYYKMNEIPEKLLELRSKKDEMISSAAISNDGKWIAYSTTTSFRLFHFQIENSKPQLMRVKSLPEELTPCNQIIFSKDSNLLITIDTDGNCLIFDISLEMLEHRQTLKLSSHHNDHIHLITVSNCSKYIAFASLCNNVSVWQLKKLKYEYMQNLPKHSHVVTSLSIHPNGAIMNVAYADNKLFEYDLRKCLVTFSYRLKEENSELPITNISFDPDNSNVVIFAQNNSINVVNKEGAIDDDTISQSSKKTKMLNGKSDVNTFKVAKKFETVIFVLFIILIRNFKVNLILAFNSYGVDGHG